MTMAVFGSILILYFHWTVYLQCRRHLKNRQKRMPLDRQQNHLKYVQNVTRSFLICVLLAASFWICWSPICYACFKIIAGKKNSWNSIMITVYFMIVNSLIDPCIFVTLDDYFKRHFKKMLGKTIQTLAGVTITDLG